MQGFNIVEDVGYKVEEGFVYENFGIVYCYFGNIEQVIKYYELEFSIVKDVGDKFGEGCVLGYFGIVFGSLGELCEVIKYYE